MGITGAIGAAKAIAGFIEKKFPGTCPDLASELEHTTQSSGFFRLKMKELQDKWNDVKDRVSDSDKTELTDQINSDGFGVDGQALWSDNGIGDIVDTVDMDGVVDVASSAAEVATDGGLLDSIGDFLSDLFS